ncbi:FAD dependent oxidoreductase [Xylariaceae sp. FL0594]|nr:FAD dependent oxidoreductase [Xylariaceae sp. FL0594]
MDERAAIPVTLPRENPTQSYWQLEVDDEAVADLRSTESLPSEADTVIVGSGITGAAVAYNLLNDGGGGVLRDVVMLEARRACSGATGRNGGHTKAASYTTFLHHAHAHGAAEAAKIARLELANIRAVHAFARERGIECESRPRRTVDVVYDPRDWEVKKKAVKALQEALPEGDEAAEYNFLDAEEVRERFFCGKGDGDVCGGIEYEAGSINAYKFTVGVLKLCLQKGLNLQTNTPVTSVSKRADGRWDVETTERGTVVANRVVLATNAYTARLLHKFQGVIVPLRGHVTAQRPGSHIPDEGLGATYSFVYEGGYDYMIPRPRNVKGFGGDIVIGGRLSSARENGLFEYGTTDDTTVDKDTVDALSKVLPEYFGDNWGGDDPEGRVRMYWSGIMGYGPDGLPFVGEMSEAGKDENRKGIWVAASFQGHGMVLCWMCARALVEMMLGRDNDDLKSWFPGAFRFEEKRFGVKFQERMAAHGDPSID